MSSLLNRAPALLVLESAAVVVHCAQSGLNMFVAQGVAALFAVAQTLLAEDAWDSRRRVLTLIVAALGAAVSAYAVKKLEEKTPLPDAVTGAFTIAERRVWGESELLCLAGEDGGRWICAARGALAEAAEGDRYSLSARARALKDETERGSFSPRKYWLARGMRGELREIRVDARLAPSFSVHALRRALRRRVRLLPGAVGALTAALLLGDRDPNLNELFRRWGVSHYLAVSGWHVGLAVMASSFLFGKRRAGLVAASAALWAYCLISGCSLSALRATLMLQIGLAGLWLGAGTAALNAVGVAGTLMLLRNPWTYFDLAWRLSILAAIVAVDTQMTRGSLASVFLSPMMWVVASPLVAPMAGGIYVSSLPINLMATAFFSFALAVVLLSALPVLLGLGFFFPALCAEKIFGAWALAADRWADWLPQALPVNFFPVSLCAALLFYLTAAALRIRLWRRLLLSLTGGFLVWLLQF